MQTARKLTARHPRRDRRMQEISELREQARVLTERADLLMEEFQFLKAAGFYDNRPPAAASEED